MKSFVLLTLLLTGCAATTNPPTATLAKTLADLPTQGLTYHYEGDPIQFTQGVYRSGDRLTGTFELPQGFETTYSVDLAGTVLSYSFTDGHQTRTKANSAIRSFWVGFDEEGIPRHWFIDVYGPDGSMILTQMGQQVHQTRLSLGPDGWAQILSALEGTYPGGPGTWTAEVQD